MNSSLLTIGIMTGNSLDGADLVMTRFYSDGRIEDIASFYLSNTPQLKTQLQKMRKYVNSFKGKDHDGNMAYFAQNYPEFDQVMSNYHQFIADAVQQFLVKENKSASEIDIIGFHGQTCGHFPPSIAGNKKTYTLQLCDGKLLSKLTGITVATDFRSDDVLNGGEGAPLAPMHNKHCDEHTGIYKVHINGGNTSNIAMSDGEKVYGWDAGPFNHLIDQVVKKYFGQDYDEDGQCGGQGEINVALLQQIFDCAAMTGNGENFFDISPPKSSDPQWYKRVSNENDHNLSAEDREKQFIPLLENDDISPADKLRTIEYAAAYTTFHTLGHAPEGFKIPSDFAVFGGGWRNPLVMDDFKSFLNGTAPHVLEEHQNRFSEIRKRIGPNATVKHSIEYGYNGTTMEARVVADLARCLVMKIPFTVPEMTGVKHPTLCGVIAYCQKSTNNLKAWIKQSWGDNNPPESTSRWSRAAATSPDEPTLQQNQNVSGTPHP